MALRVSRRLLDVTSPLPTPPAGTGVIFHSRLRPVKYALNGNKWMALTGSAFIGAFSGHFFYKKFVMAKNPPNICLRVRYHEKRYLMRHHSNSFHVKVFCETVGEVGKTGRLGCSCKTYTQPPRNPNEKPPERHPHAPLEDE